MAKQSNLEFGLTNREEVQQKQKMTKHLKEMEKIFIKFQKAIHKMISYKCNTSYHITKQIICVKNSYLKPYNCKLFVLSIN